MSSEMRDKLQAKRAAIRDYGGEPKEWWVELKALCSVIEDDFTSTAKSVEAYSSGNWFDGSEKLKSAEVIARLERLALQADWMAKTAQAAVKEHLALKKSIRLLEGPGYRLLADSVEP